jgi:LysM repeat protein
MRSVTREHKLALIVGFSLILLVGVLISDHLSRARQARIASVSRAEESAPAVVAPPSTDPLGPLEIALSQPPNPANQAPTGPTPADSTAAAPPSPQTQPESRPVTIAQGRHNAHPADPDAELRREVEGQGGVILQGADGGRDIVVPPAAADLSRRLETSAQPPAPIAPATSRIDNLAPTTKNLATNTPVKYHAVAKGETLFQISAKYYGTGHLWRELASFNGVTNKDGVVRAGSKLKIPGKEALLGKAPAAPDSKPSKKPEPGAKPEVRYATYTVKQGETLGEISRKVLGTSKRWQELADFNHLDDEDNIAAGTVLKVPPSHG